jgi:hypothetical protein
MCLRPFALTFLVTLWSSSAFALYGSDVLKTCENTSGYNEGFCFGYLLGAVDFVDKRCRSADVYCSLLPRGGMVVTYEWMSWRLVT